MMESSERIRRAAITALQELQCENGSWPSLSDTDQNHSRVIERPATTVTLLTTLALLELDLPETRAMVEKALHWILAQCNSGATVNYWHRHRPSTLQKYPDDLDDSAAALHCLALSSGLDGEKKTTLLASFTKSLLHLEKHPGGPYRTWFIDETSTSDALWLDYDPAVNAQVAWLMSDLTISLPPLTTYLRKNLHKKSPYYTSTLPQLWYASHVPTLRKSIKLPSYPELDTDGWLYLAISQNLAAPLPAHLLEALVKKQLPNGLFPSQGCIVEEPSTSGKSYLGGGHALTTALAIQVLSKYDLSLKKPELRSRTNQEAIATFLNWHRTLPPVARHQTKALATTITSGKHAEFVTSLATFAQHAVWGTESHAPSRATTLAEAALFGWFAYTIFDHAYDSNHTTPLPTALEAHRKMVDAFSLAMPDDREWQLFVDSILTTMDRVNQWEILHRTTAKGGKWKLINLGNRALGHALPLLAEQWIALKDRNSSPANHPQFQALVTYAVHALTAKQLCDDAHDWKEDTAAGICTPVCEWQKQLEVRYPSLSTETVYWTKTLPHTAKVIFRQLTLANQALHRSGIAHPETLRILTDSSKQVAHDILARYRDTKIFQETLKTPTASPPRR